MKKLHYLFTVPYVISIILVIICTAIVMFIVTYWREIIIIGAIFFGLYLSTHIDNNWTL